MSSLHEQLSSDELTVTDLGGKGGVLLDMRRNQILTFNRHGMMLLHLLRQDMARQADLVDYLIKRYGIDRSIAEDDVDAFLKRLTRFLNEG